MIYARQSHQASTLSTNTSLIEVQAGNANLRLAPLQRSPPTHR